MYMIKPIAIIQFKLYTILYLSLFTNSPILKNCAHLEYNFVRTIMVRYMVWQLFGGLNLIGSACECVCVVKVAEYSLALAG